MYENIKYVEKLSYEKKFKLDLYDYVCFCPEINEYLLVLTVPWVSYYSRYYWIPESDYELAQIDIDKFREKYKENFSSLMELPKGENFVGAEALRDYDGRRNFQRYISSGIEGVINSFQHFLYVDKVLYAHILMNGVHYAVLPYRIIMDVEGKYIRPLENNEGVETIYGDVDGEKLSLFTGIKIDTFEGIDEWQKHISAEKRKGR